MKKHQSTNEAIEFNWGSYNVGGLKQPFPGADPAVWKELHEIRELIDAGFFPKPRPSGGMLVFRRDPTGSWALIGRRDVNGHFHAEGRQNRASGGQIGHSRRSAQSAPRRLPAGRSGENSDVVAPGASTPGEAA